MSARSLNHSIWEHYQNQNIDSFSQSGPRLQALVNRVAKSIPPGGRVLNVGAGNGQLEYSCLQRGYEIHSLDLSEQTVEELARNGVSARKGSIAQAPFGNNTFDAIVISEVLEHLSVQEMRAALIELARMIRPSGIVIGTVPFEENLKENSVFCPGCKLEFHKWGHQQSFSKASLISELEKIKGVRAKLKVRTFVAYRGRGIKGFFKSVVRAALARLGEQIADPHLYFEFKK